MVGYPTKKYLPLPCFPTSTTPYPYPYPSISTYGGQMGKARQQRDPTYEVGIMRAIKPYKEDRVPNLRATGETYYIKWQPLRDHINGVQLCKNHIRTSRLSQQRESKLSCGTVPSNKLSDGCYSNRFACCLPPHIHPYFSNQ